MLAEQDGGGSGHLEASTSQQNDFRRRLWEETAASQGLGYLASVLLHGFGLRKRESRKISRAQQQGTYGDHVSSMSTNSLKDLQ